MLIIAAIIHQTTSSGARISNMTKLVAETSMDSGGSKLANSLENITPRVQVLPLVEQLALKSRLSISNNAIVFKN